MLAPYEKKLLATCYQDAARVWRNEPRLLFALSRALEDASIDLGIKYNAPEAEDLFDQGSSTAGKRSKKNRAPKPRDLDEGEREAFDAALIRAVKKHEKEPPSEDYGFLDKALGGLGFDETDRKIASLLLLSSRRGFQSFFDVYEDLKGVQAPRLLLAGFMGLEKKEIHRRMRIDAPLMGSGFVYSQTLNAEQEPILNRLTFYLQLKLLDLIEQADYDLDHFLDKMLGKAVLPETEWEDFSHLSKEASFAARLLKSALDSKESGVNILIYGDSGTGKTELCKVLAARLGVPLYTLGETEHDPDDVEDDVSSYEPGSAEERLADLRLVEHMLTAQGGKQALTLFDEMEDLLAPDEVHSSGRRFASFIMSKARTNRLFADNKVPRLWTTNNIDRYDPSMLRRFSFVIELKTPTVGVRANVINRTLRRYGQELTSTQTRKLAVEHVVPPAFFNAAIGASALASQTGDGAFDDDLSLALRNVSRLVGANDVRTVSCPSALYDIDLTHANEDLKDLAQKIVKARVKRFSICGYGLSGTGKSEYLIYLAHLMGKEALLVPYSSIASSGVGDTEQALAERFEQALDEDKFLVFDEADSVLRRRDMARQTWEVTLVDEMLNQIARHAGPVGCTTNLMHDIDKASLRRFTFKIEFKALKPEQVRTAFQRYFSLPLPRGAGLPTQLTLGDFANVTEQAVILERMQDPDWLVKKLCAEAKSRGTSGGRQIGFVRSTDLVDTKHALG